MAVILGSSFSLHTQTAGLGGFNGGAGTVQPAQNDSYVQVAAESQGLSQVAPADLPRGATYWWVTPDGIAAPFPCPPPDLSVPIYQITDSQFLVDETGGQVTVNTRRLGLLAQTSVATVAAAVVTKADAVVNFINQIQDAQFTREVAAALGMDFPSLPGDGGGSPNDSGGSSGSSYTVPDYGTNLWITQVAVASGYLMGIATNTQADIRYEIQSRTNLLQSDWQSEGFINGSETNNWTPLSVAQNGRPILFLRLRSWASSDGSGLPDWWELEYFGHTGIDPNALDSAGDGWTIYQKFQMGLNPNQFYTPAAPQGVTVNYNINNGTANISWQPSLGAVTGYTVMDSNGNTYNLGGNATNLQINVPGWQPAGTFYDGFGPYQWITYQVQAHYVGGNSSVSSIDLEPSYYSFYSSGFLDSCVSLVINQQGVAYLAASALPPGTTSFWLTRQDDYAIDNYNDFSCYNSNYKISVSSSTNGLYPIPATWLTTPTDVYGMAQYTWWVQTVNTNNGTISSPIPLSPEYDTYAIFLSGTLVPPFYDGRVQMKQNLIFKLRAAQVDTPFQFNYDFDTYGDYQTAPTNYAYSGYYHGGYDFDPLFPFTDNALFQNFVFNTANLDADTGFINTGVALATGTQLELSVNPTYQFHASGGSWTNLPGLLSTSDTSWLCSTPFYNNSYDSEQAALRECGLTRTTGTTNYNFFLGTAYNVFGLELASVKLVDSANLGYTLTTLNANSSVAIPIIGSFYAPYVGAAQPQFQLVEYDFWEPGYQFLPGSPGFSPTHQSQLLVTPVGSTGIQVAGYAKLAVANSAYSGVYGYLGQYFDQAYKMTNGVMSSTATGVLSQYGNFFATEPGPVALVTMPDIDTRARGTCMVYCVSLVLDKNHDGTMDGSFNGPDATSQVSPMECWVNNGHDQPAVKGSLDNDLEVPPASANYTTGQIACPRNLENFFRLWVCGLPKLPTSQGYTITLSISPSSGNPAINLYPAYSSDGGTEYLTDTNEAAAQISTAYVMGSPVIAYGTALGTINANQSYTLPVDGYGNLVFTNFLFEAAGIGAGQLMMTISQNGNTLAQTSAYLDLHDIKDFYERVTITNVLSGPSTNWTSVIDSEQFASSLALGSDTNLIVFVHGFDVGNWNWLDDSETVFKRLYWAGFNGQFATVKWPCQTGDPLLFDLSESYAYKANTGLATYLNQLRSRFPGYRLNILAHSQGNAIVSEAIRNQGVLVDTYILTQGAVAASAYDMNAPTDTTLLNAEIGNPTPDRQPMGYHGVYTNLSGRIISFYNTGDFALETGTMLGIPVANWRANQAIKPDADYGSDGINVWEYVTGAPNMPITDSEVSRAFVARSRSDAVGATAGLGGVINSSIDLNAQFGFGATLSEHSAEWTRPIQTSRPYYQQVLRSCLIQPAP